MLRFKIKVTVKQSIKEKMCFSAHFFLKNWLVCVIEETNLHNQNFRAEEFVKMFPTLTFFNFTNEIAGRIGNMSDLIWI